MKKWLLLVSACALAIPAATGALAQSMGEKTGVDSVLGIAPSTDDFAKELAASDMFEIQSSQLALQKGDDQTKAFARQMITDHSKTTDDLKSFISSGKVKAELPAGMNNAQQSMIDKLKGLNGADFDKQYESDQVSAHKTAVSLFQRYAQGGDNDALKDWAGKTLPILQHHLQMAQNLSTTHQSER